MEREDVTEHRGLDKKWTEGFEGLFKAAKISLWRLLELFEDFGGRVDDSVFVGKR